MLFANPLATDSILVWILFYKFVIMHRMGPTNELVADQSRRCMQRLIHWNQKTLWFVILAPNIEMVVSGFASIYLSVYF